MANKYIRHGETYCGDGTTSAAATSNGGVGAWNNLNVFEGTAPAYGVLAAGDVVYIRSLDSTGAAITRPRTTTVAIGSSAATLENPIKWVIDRNSVWTGIAGTIIYTLTLSGVGVSILSNNAVIANAYNLVFSTTTTSGSNSDLLVATNCFTKDIKIDSSSNTTPSVAGPRCRFQGGCHINLWVRQGEVTYHVLTCDSNTDTTLINPNIEIIGPLYFAASSTAVFATGGGFTNKFLVYGGSVTTLISGLALYTNDQYAGLMEFNGLQFPSTMTLSNAALFNLKSAVTSNGNDGILGNAYHDYFYSYSSRFDGYYPTLNAFLELSGATPWAYCIYPFRTTFQNPAQVSTSKLWTQDAAIKTITVEFLWPTSMAAPTSDKVYVSLGYIDSASGAKRQECSQAFPGEVHSISAALWSATSYGPTNFTKYSISITTSTSIKKDTEVIITFISSPMSASPNDIIMLCPDAVFS